LIEIILFSRVLGTHLQILFAPTVVMHVVVCRMWTPGDGLFAMVENVICRYEQRNRKPNFGKSGITCNEVRFAFTFFYKFSQDGYLNIIEFENVAKLLLLLVFAL
jgi:hypothetical protein